LKSDGIKVCIWMYFQNSFCMCLYDKLISKSLLVIISFRDITYKC